MNILRTYVNVLKWFMVIIIIIAGAWRVVPILITVTLFLIGMWLKSKTVRIAHIKKTPKNKKREGYQLTVSLVLFFGFAVFAVIFSMFSGNSTVPVTALIVALLILIYFGHHIDTWK